jgi:glc operon protein GlcG
LFEDIVNKGRTAMTALPDSLFTPLQGGVPIEVDGRVVGAVGVSGAASAQQDEDIAVAAIAAWRAMK